MTEEINQYNHNHNNDDATYVGFHNVATMPYPLSDMTTVIYDIDFIDQQGPRVYLVGGCIANQNCTAGISKCTEAWHQDCSVTNVERYRHMAAKVGDSMYIAGGRHLNDSLIDTIERYHISSNTWSIEAIWQLADNLASDGAAFADNNNNILYLVGGYNIDYSVAYNTLTGYNVVTKTFTTSHPAMEYGRGDISVINLHGSTDFYVIGGWNITDNSTSNFCIPTKYVEYYSLTDKTWTQVADLDYGRGDFAVGLLDNNIFVVGGETKDSNCSISVPVRYVERYEDTKNAWNDEENIPSDLFRFVGTSYNSSIYTNKKTTAIYLFGGQGGYDSINKIYPLKDSTIKYIPASTVHHRDSNNDDLSSNPGAISGIIIGGIVVISVIVFGILSYLGYKNRQFFLPSDLRETESIIHNRDESNIESGAISVGADDNDQVEAQL